MPSLSPDARHAVAELAGRHGFPAEAVAHLLGAVIAGGGGMAQFSHPAFGGPGQWMRGGMTMVSDLSDGTLRARVAALCEALAGAVAAAPRAFAAEPSSPAVGSDAPWWGEGLGRPDSTGAQDGLRYAYFAAPRRLAVEAGGRVTLHDTGGHAIGGFAQQQGPGTSLRLTGPHGTVDLASLPVVTADDARPAAGPAAQAQAPIRREDPGAAEAQEPATPDGVAPARSPASRAGPPMPTTPVPPPSPVPAAEPAGGFGAAANPAASSALLDTVERLSALRDRGILGDEEFAAKKAELLARL